MRPRYGVLSMAALVWLAGCLTATSVAPNPAAPGDSITIAGTGFGTKTGTDAVLYDGAEIATVSWTDTAIVATVPLGKPNGTYPVQVRKSGALSATLNHRVESTLALTNPVLTPNPYSVLSATITFDTSLSATPSVEVNGPSGSWTVPTSGILTTSPGFKHKAIILGLKLGDSYTFTLRATRPSGTVSSSSLAFTAGPLPADMPAPPITVLTSNTAEMQPGVTMFADNRGNGPIGVFITSTIYGVDAGGNLVWYYRPTYQGVADVHRLSNGHFTYVAAGKVIEVDMMGNIINAWSGATFGVTGFHHFADELPGGNMVSLGSELRTYGPYSDGNTYPVVGDVIVEWTRTGQLVRTISLFDILDPLRVPDWPSFATPFWDDVYNTTGTKDWSHANAIEYDASDDTFVVSVNHQDIIIKIDRTTGQLRWVLGADLPSTSGDDGWPFLDFVGPGLLPNHSHELQVLPDGHLALYDNGNTRPPEEKKSRAVEYAIDAVHGEASEVWSWFDPDYTPSLLNVIGGDADVQPVGTVLVANSGQWTTYPFGVRWAQYAEVRKSDNVKVWEMVVQDPAGLESHTGFNSERLATLYPSP
ncbi:MAG: aryl-sulfate sulfotransferase [bacterium]